MSRAFFNIFVSFLKAFARLPLGVLYIFSDVFYFLMRYVVRYRRKLVRTNISDCFPALDASEIKNIEKQFYRNFSDYIVETVKLLHISDEEMKQRMVFENIELLEKLVGEGRCTVAYFTHCWNWEWATSVTMHFAAKSDFAAAHFAQVYRPLRNKNFDELMLKIRSRFNSESFPKNTVFRDMLKWKRSATSGIVGFMSDQKPSHGDPTQVIDFLGRPTPFITGTETLARKLDTAVVYWDIEKVSRGHYKIICRLITDDIANTQQGEITAKYARMLEATIQRNPAIWLWSHNRWKIKR